MTSASSQSKIAPCLWFDGRAEEAAQFYVSLLPGSRIDTILRLAAETPGGGPGDVLSVEFTLAGAAHIALNGGPHYTFTPALSLFVRCDDQAEVDRLWAALLDGGAAQRCGWLTDRYGVSWQVVPKALGPMLADDDRTKVKRVMDALLGMVKIDIAGLEAAYNG